MCSLFSRVILVAFGLFFLFPSSASARGQLQLTYQQKKDNKLYSLALPVYEPLIGPLSYTGWVSSTFSEKSFRYMNLEQGVQVSLPVTVSAVIGTDIYAKQPENLTPYFLVRLSTNLWD